MLKTEEGEEKEERKGEIRDLIDFFLTTNDLPHPTPQPYCLQ